MFRPITAIETICIENRFVFRPITDIETICQVCVFMSPITAIETICQVRFQCLDQ